MDAVRDNTILLKYIRGFQAYSRLDFLKLRTPNKEDNRFFDFGNINNHPKLRPNAFGYIVEIE
jgi:hypothetical protein